MGMKLTIGIPVYKEIDTLKVAIESILSQQNREIECKLIISEDYSSEIVHEKILELINEYEESIEIQYYFNKPALGMCGNWNQCVKLADTEYVALLHDDDFLYPNYFDGVKKVLESNNSFDVLFWNTDLYRDGVKLSETCQGIRRIYSNLKKDKIKKYKSADYFFGGMEGKTLPTCGTLYKKKGFQEYSSQDGFSTDEIYAEKFCGEKQIYFYNKIVSGHTYRTNMNLSSMRNTKRAFVLEKAKHRMEMKRKSIIFLFCNVFLKEGMKYDSMFPWEKELFPEYCITKKIVLQKKIFSIIKRVHIYLQVFTYNKVK